MEKDGAKMKKLTLSDQELELIIDGEKFAVSLYEGAKKTCEAILKVLPLEAPLHHGIFSGEIVFFGHDDLPNVEREGWPYFRDKLSQGDVWCPALPNVLGRFMVIAYGRASCMRGYQGEYPGNAFGVVKPEHLARMEEVGQEVFLKGPKKIVVRKRTK
ncbi:MAG: DUF3830 family protein [Candidatus Bathyarchaeia archaeon]|jgi:hypothetical protein